MSTTHKTVRVQITGRVQGVSFRAWTRDLARANGLTGWVRNEADGSVSALLSGEETAVEAMLKRLEDGPPAARVSGVTSRPADGEDAGTAFVIA